MITLDGAVRVESHREIGLHEEEKEGGALCVHVCVHTCTTGTLCAINDII